MTNRTHWVLVGGDELLNVHARGECHGQYCCIHHFSDHHMTAWPQRWLNGRMYRECPHGLFHPDPDARRGDVVHVCEDACCKDPVDRLSLQELVDDLREMIEELS